MSVISVKKILNVGGVGTFIYFNVDYKCEEFVLPIEQFTTEDINPDDRYLAVVSDKEVVNVLEKLPETPAKMSVQDIVDFYPDPVLSFC
jgi:hypothetical protein